MTKRTSFSKSGRLTPVSHAITNVITKKGIKAQEKARTKAKLDAEKATKKACQTSFAAAWKAAPKWRTIAEYDIHHRFLGIVTYKITKDQFKVEWLRDRSACSTYL